MQLLRSPRTLPVFTVAERALHEQIMAGLSEGSVPPPRHVPVDVELRNGARVVSLHLAPVRGLLV